MNPIICFDELDKLADNSKGNEVFNVLIHLTDATQNDSFDDQYFAGVRLDLSRAIIVFTYNDESKVHPVLKDRMVCIPTKSYSATDVAVIIKEYMLPKIAATFSMQGIGISDEGMKCLTGKGMREVGQILEMALSVINLNRIESGDDIPEVLTPEMLKPCIISNAKTHECSHMYL